MTLALNLINLKTDIEKTCQECDRDPSEVKLVAVSKFVPVETMIEVYEQDVRAFGENRVQEFASKKMKMPSDVEWHFIGRLQTNKVKDVLGDTYLIHSLDRLELANEIEKQASKRGLNKIACLIQVNLSKESTKAGFLIEEVEPFLRERLAKTSKIDLQGLMTMGPHEASDEQIRNVFRQGRELFEKIRKDYHQFENFKHLSMGMSSDYKLAIQEGATMIRIGSKLFGNRVKA